jgi:hypothetical protein
MGFELILPFLRPIEPLLLDQSVSEIMGNPDATWWFERDGILRSEGTIQFDASRLRTGLEVIANQLGKRLDEDNPLLHAQLPDGSRLAAVIPPIVRPAPALTIRKFTSGRFTVGDLIARGTLTPRLSTHDQQTLPMQIRGPGDKSSSLAWENRAMREYAARRGWTIALQVNEVGSGASQRQLREKLL